MNHKAKQNISPARLGMMLTALAASAPTWAQEATGADTPSNPPDSAARYEPEEVIVTARKRSETLLETPVAVTAVTAADLEAQSIAAIDDLSNTVPNVSFSTGAGDNGVGAGVVFIRGIGQTDYSNATDPGVGTYVDGVYLGRTIGAILELPDVQQIEVLRGPQGTLFGKNTMGGAINVSTQRPSFENRGSLSVTAGEDNRLNVDGEGDLRLGKNLAARLAVSTRSQDGFVERLNGGEATGAEEAVVGRTKLEYDAGGPFRLLLSADYSDIGGTTPRVVTFINEQSTLAVTWNALYAAEAGQAISNEYSTSDLRSTNATGSYDNSFEGGGASLNLEWDLRPNLLLRSISAYRTFESFAEADQDGQSIDWGFTVYGDDQSQVTQEFNVLGSAFDDRLNWIAGLYYFFENSDADQLINIADPLVRFRNLFSTDSSSYAVFAEGNYQLSERLSLTMGLRYTQDEKDFSAQTLCRDGIGFAFLCDPNGAYLPLTTASESWSSVDPRVGVKYRFNPDWMAYATYSTGYKSGGFNARANNPEQVEPFDPETVTSYEIGTKGQLADGRLTLSSAVFFYQYDDYQVTATGTDLETGIATAVVGNVGEAEVQGIELEAQVRPTGQVTLQAAVGYVEAEYTSLSAELVDFFASTGNPPITLDNELPKTPKLTASLGAELRSRLPNEAQLRSRLDYAWIDEQDSDVQNFDGTRSPSHYNLNGRISYEPRSERWLVAVYGKNLTDEVYIVNGFIPDGGNGTQTLIVPNEPREIGVQLKVNFGG